MSAVEAAARSFHDKEEARRLQRQRRIRDVLPIMWRVAHRACDSFRDRGYIFAVSSAGVVAWDGLICLVIMYSTFFLPLTLVFHRARYSGQPAVDSLADMMLIIDVLVNFRTSYIDRGYEVTSSTAIASRYMRTWALPDILAALPFSSAAGRGTFVDASVRVIDITHVEMWSALRILSIGRLMRVFSRVSGSRSMSRMPVLMVLLPVCMLMYLFGEISFT